MVVGDLGKESSLAYQLQEGFGPLTPFDRLGKATSGSAHRARPISSTLSHHLRARSDLLTIDETIIRLVMDNQNRTFWNILVNLGHEHKAMTL